MVGLRGFFVCGLVVFCCFLIVSMHECLQFQFPSGFAIFCRSSSLKPFVLPKADTYMLSAFSSNETRQEKKSILFQSTKDNA